jgi:AcrR family transcriptional regulator
MNDGNHDQPVPRRERKKQEKEERILEAAAAVFARKGFHRATVREIAELADVADGTIYNYYANKRDLLVAMTRHVIAGSTGEALAQYQAQGDPDLVTALLNDRFDFAKENLAFVRVLLSQVWTDTSFREQYLSEVIEPLLQLMEGYLQSRIEAGTIRPLNTSVVVRALAGSFLIFVMLADVEQEGGLFPGLSNKQLAGEVAEFFLLGLQARLAQEESGTR